MEVEYPLDKIPAKPWATTRGNWSVKEGAVWGGQKKDDKQGACLRTPLTGTDLVIQYELCFRGADRHSLRIELPDKAGSFRIEVGRTYFALTKNPLKGEAQDKVAPLARKVLQLEKNEWYPVRVTLHGKEAEVEIAVDTVATAKA